MTLIRYELKKLRGARTVLLVTAGIVLAGLLYVVWLLAGADGGVLIQQVQLFHRLDKGTPQEMAAQVEVHLAEQQAEYMAALEDPALDAAQYARQIWLCSAILEDVETVAGYDELLDQLIQGSGGISGLMVQSAYRQRDLLAAQVAYGKLRGLELPVVFSGGVNLLLKQPVLDLALLLIAMVWVLFLLLLEYDNGTLAYTRLTRKGVWSTLCAKGLVLVGLLSIATLALYGGGLAVVCTLTGGLPWSAPVQSISALVRCPFSLSIGQFCLLFAASKLIAVLSCTALFGMLCTLWRNMIPAVLTFGAVFGVEWLLARYISPFSALGLAARLNLIHALDSLSLFAQWNTIDLFGWPAPLWGIWLVVLTILTAACFGGLGHFFAPPHGCESRRLPVPCRLRKEKTVRLRPTQTLFWYEGKKLWRTQSGGLLLCTVALLQLLCCAQVHRWMDAEEAYYASYMTVLGGIPTAEKGELTARIEEEFSEEERLLVLAAAEYEQGTITFEEYTVLCQMYTVSDSQKAGWARARGDYQRTLALREKGIAAFCVSQDGWDLLFGTAGAAADCLQCLFLSAGLILGLSNYSAMEHSSGMAPLLVLSSNWRQAERAKHIHAALYATSLAVVVFLPRRLAVMNRYGIGLGKWPVQSLRLLEDWPLSMPVWLVFLLRLLLDIVLPAIAGELMLYLSAKVKNRFAIALIGTVVLVIPVCVAWNLLTAGK